MSAKRAVRVPSARGPLGRGLVILAVFPCGQVTCPLARSTVNSSLSIVSASAVRVTCSGAEHLGLALLELLPDFEVAVGGVAEHPRRPPAKRLLVDERGGVVAVVFVAR